ncbi:hypothetical protein G5S37_15930 [Roseimicrobium sp. ORNL1]|nr:hypothetical protein G5S37_15930 [Roseimicrobium sp. ORNL1]
MEVLLWKRYGRLGNRLLTFGNLVALAMSRGWQVHNLSFGEYADSFHHFRGRSVASWTPSGNLGVLGAFTNTRIGFKVAARMLGSAKFNRILRFQGSIFEAPDEHELTVADLARQGLQDGHSWLVWTAWNLKFDELREQWRGKLVDLFQPAVHVVAAIDDRLRHVPRGKILVGIHVRRGDYAEYLGGRYYFDHAQYREMMLQVVKLLSPRQVHFIVASDERIPEQLVSGMSSTLLDGTEIEDLYALARCRIVIGPPSTYSEWAAFYGGGDLLVFTGQPPQSLDLKGEPFFAEHTA